MQFSKGKLWIVALFIAFILPCATYLLRDGFFDDDSYYFLTHICARGSGTYSANPFTPAANIMFDLLPCNETWLKIFLIALYAIDLALIFFIVERNVKGAGLAGLLFAGITGQLLQSGFKLENDALALPFALVAVYFFLEYLESKNNRKNNYVALIVSLFALLVSAFFWGGTLYYIAGFAASEIMLVPLLAIFTLFDFKLIATFLPRFDVVENNPAFGFFLAAVALLSARKFKFFQLPFCIMMIIIGAINPKYMVLAVPAIAVLLAHTYSAKDETYRKAMIVYASIISIAFALIFAPFINSQIFPTQSEILAAKETVQYANTQNIEIANDWDYGHLIFYFGGRTAQHSGPPSFDPNLIARKAVLTRAILWDCTLVKEYRENTVFGEKITARLYNC